MSGILQILIGWVMVLMGVWWRCEIYRKRKRQLVLIKNKVLLPIRKRQEHGRIIVGGRVGESCPPRQFTKEEEICRICHTAGLKTH